MYYVHLAMWPLSLFGTVSGSMVHIHLATVETAVNWHELSLFLRGQGSMRAVSLLDVVEVHGLGSIILISLAVSVIIVCIFIVVDQDTSIFLVSFGEECGIESFSHLLEFSESFVSLID